MEKNSTFPPLPLVLAFFFAVSIRLSAQTVIGGASPHPSAILDVQCQQQGVFFPRMTQEQRDLITNAAAGLMIFNTTENRLQINMGNPGSVFWLNIDPLGAITALSCSTALVTGNLYAGQAASGVSVDVPYTGGNGGVYQSQTVISTGVTGLTATLAAGHFAQGSGTLSFSITGTPATTGTASFEWNVGGQNCTLTLTVAASFTLNCTDAIRKGEMQPNFSLMGYRSSYPTPGEMVACIPVKRSILPG